MYFVFIFGLCAFFLALLFRLLAREREIYLSGEGSFDWVGPDIAIGSLSAGNPEIARRHFDAVLNVSLLESQYVLGKYYMDVGIAEGDGEAFSARLPEMLNFIRRCDENNLRLLILGRRGVNRPVAVYLAYLCAQNPPKVSEDVLWFIRAIQDNRPEANPHEVYVNVIMDAYNLRRLKWEV